MIITITIMIIIVVVYSIQSDCLTAVLTTGCENENYIILVAATVITNEWCYHLVGQSICK